jgi:hypothetical protein
MYRTIVLLALTTAAGAFAYAHAQVHQPTDAERLAQTAKDFGMTPEQLEQFIRKEMGDPVVVDGDLIVGVHRDAAGHVTAVQVTTPARSLKFNRVADAKNPGLRYSRADLTDTPNMGVADDLDGDGRIDRVMLTPTGEKLPHILLRLGASFVQAKPVGDSKFQTDDGRTFAFDSAQHEWVAVK